MSDANAQAHQDPQPPSDRPSAGPQIRLRLWPGVALMVVMWLARTWAITGDPAPQKYFFGLVIVPLAVLVGIVLWWLLASRLPWSDRGLVVGVFAAVVAGTLLSTDPSLHGPALLLFAPPIVANAWVGWLLLSFWLPWPARRAVLLLLLIAPGIGFCLVRAEGMTGSFSTAFHWRWSPTPEQQYLAELQASPPQQADVPQAEVPRTALSEQPGDWPAFRGPRRDGRLLGVQIKTDWQKSPPQKLWRHRIGPGWSSFAVIGDRLFTQEQRGDDEYVVCYDATNGKQVWAHHDDAIRFTESMGGDGPRATPTFHAGRLYTQGAKGLLNCLDAASGQRLWSHNVVTDCGAEVPMWAFASSPLVAHGLVVVFAGAPKGKTLVAYHEEKGDLAWTAGVGPAIEKAALSYSSPQLATLDGVEQILFVTEAGLSAFEPASGKQFWHHAWVAENTPRIVQPALLGNGDVLIGTGMGKGTRRIHVDHDGEDWPTDELWTKTTIRPYFNDLVVLNDYLYGFDTGKFLCISLKDGSEAWRATGYGSGQVLLLADQELLLIMSEQGEVALVPARPEKYEELCRFKALEGKTWNHPVIAHGNLYVRNGEEIACYKLGLLEVAAGAAEGRNRRAVKPVGNAAK